jgi:hypothetical protein
LKRLHSRACAAGDCPYGLGQLLLALWIAVLARVTVAQAPSIRPAHMALPLGGRAGESRHGVSLGLRPRKAMAGAAL